MGYVFISYSSEDQEKADFMKQSLENAGVQTWMSSDDILPGSNFPEAINKAIKECTCVLLMLSNNSQNSQWVEKEIERAVHYNKYIIPVQIEDVILNDAFGLLIGNAHVVSIRQFDENSQELRKITLAVSNKLDNRDYVTANYNKLKNEDKTAEQNCKNCDDNMVFTRDMTIEYLKKNTTGVLTIPEGVTSLSGDFAAVFDWMPEKMCQQSFRELVIPATVKTIDGILLTEYGPDEAPVKRFKKINVSLDNPYFTSIDGVLFTKDVKNLICYPCGKNGDKYIVPDTVEVISERAFSNNVYLDTIVLPDTLKKIEDQAFFQCNKLRNLNLPEGLSYLGEECFDLSFDINRLKIPKSLEKLYTSTFSCGVVIEIPDELTELEYDHVPTEWLDMPYSGPAILSRNNDMIVDFAESYDYNYFVGYHEDSNGIIWSDNGETLICFPSKWESEHYQLTDNVRYVYIKAFSSTTLKSFSSKRKITIVGRDTDMPRYAAPLSGYNFILGYKGEISCTDAETTES